VRAALLAHKEHARSALVGPLAALLASAVRAVTQDVAVAVATCVLVPVPSLRSSVRARGHDSVHDLAREASRQLDGTPPVHRALRHTRHVRDQSGLDVAERRDNLDSALGVRGHIGPGRTVVLVDDLCSSGATLASAACALHRTAGVTQVVAAVVAAPRLRRRRGRY
jgi:predicted amidophosphoribosyltransferase